MKVKYMKKYVYLIAFLFGFTSAVNANGVNLGVSVIGGVFDADGAEKFTGDHVSGASADNVTKKTATEGDEAETAFYFGSLFAEKELNDTFAVGIDYVPMSLDSEETENIQRSGGIDKQESDDATNKVSVSFEDMVTLYATVRSPVGVYAKVGYIEVEVVTNDNLGTGGSYGDTTMEGYIVGVGYNHDLDSGAFVRLEANMMEFDDIKLTNKNDSFKTVEATGIEGYGARVSIGRSF
tara:strand:+ start:624 stop:1334 length:711 start_codon:yes stop_codon:yes gene_type:complete